jgi:hypothetical protein
MLMCKAIISAMVSPAGNKIGCAIADMLIDILDGDRGVAGGVLHLAFIGCAMPAGDDFEQGAFARAVGTSDGVDTS